MTTPQEAARQALADALWTANNFDPLAKYANVKRAEVESFAADILAALQADPDAARAVVALLGGEGRKERVMNDLDLLELAWGVIANAGGGDWERESSDWQEAAARWRTDYHARLDRRTPSEKADTSKPPSAAPQDDREAEYCAVCGIDEPGHWHSPPGHPMHDFAATPEPTEVAPSIDVAWRAAEALLPNGYQIERLHTQDGVLWEADAIGPEDGWFHGSGPDKVAALQALAARLAVKGGSDG